VLDINRIEALARALDGSPVTELLLVEGETEIRFARSPEAAGPVSDEFSAPDPPAPAPPRERLITARRVGVFHHPRRDIQVGDRIEAGTVVGYIEALRIPTEVIADCGGIVAQFFADEGVPVEYGQELLLLMEIDDETTQA